MIQVTDCEADWRLLDPGERDRAAAFRGAPARSTYVTSRAAQRRIAELYGAGASQRVRINQVSSHCRQGHGRPWIEGAGFGYFVSHTTTWVAVAVKRTSHRLAAELTQLDVSRPTAATVRVPTDWPADPVFLTDLPDHHAHVGAVASTCALREVLVMA